MLAFLIQVSNTLMYVVFCRRIQSDTVAYPPEKIPQKDEEMIGCGMSSYFRSVLPH